MMLYVRNVSHVYHNKKKSDDAKPFVEGHQMNSSYKSSSMEDHSVSKKSQIVWTKGLNKKFLEAIGKLGGIDNASPKKIVALMNVDGLTRDHVSSHLQKYRISIKRRTNACNDVHAASKQYLLNSTKVNATSLKNSSYMHNREQMKRASYSGMHTTNLQHINNSSSCFPFFDAAKFFATTSCAFTRTVSAQEEEILKGFQSEDKFFLAKGATTDATSNVSNHTYQYNKKSSDANSCREENEMNSSSNNAIVKDRCSGTNSKFIWTKDMKEKFLEAIGKLGIDNATPKKIQEFMKVDGLTRDHVASFLQKYRILLKTIANTSYNVQAAPKPYLLESSKVNGTSFINSSMTVDQVQKNWPSYTGMLTSNPPLVDASSSRFPFFEDTNFNATTSSSLMRSGWNGNMGNVTAEDNLVLNETDIASLLS